jgi:hypothetical protein
MSDALAGNQQDSILVLVLLCLVHARRQFFEIKEFYPEVCEPVLEAIRQVYKHEREIQDLQLDAAARLLYHQQNSQTLLEKMKGWLLNQMDQRLIEPNSPGGAVTASVCIVNEQFERRVAPVGENEQRSQQRVFTQLLAAQSD